MQVEAGTIWAGRDRKKFVVISVTEVDGHTWVHYRDDSGINGSHEYSCYEESFIQRFSPALNESKISK
jgi:hypothetical protein